MWKICGFLLIICSLVWSLRVSRESAQSRGLCNLSKTAVFLSAEQSPVYTDPPHFPLTIEELANDTAYCIKFALIRKLQRMKVVVRSSLLCNDDYRFTWLMMVAKSLHQDHATRVRIVIDEQYSADRLNDLMTQSMEFVSKTDAAKLSSLRISYLHDTKFSEKDKDDAIIVYNIYNVRRPDADDTLDKLQGLCLNAAIHKVPMVLINPEVVSYGIAVNPLRSVIPTLVNDFMMVYEFQDNVSASASGREWFGLVQRFASTCDLFYVVRRQPSNHRRDMSTFRIVSKEKGNLAFMYGKVNEIAEDQSTLLESLRASVLRSQ